MGPSQRRLATGSRRRAEARLGSRLRMARLFPSAPAEVGVEPSPFKRNCGDDLGSVHNVRAISIPCSTLGFSFYSRSFAFIRGPKSNPIGPRMNANERE